MGLSHIVTGITVFLTGLVPMSCHKTASTASGQPKASATTTTNAAVANTPQHNLGEVALTNHIETCVQLGGGKDCTFIPKVLDKQHTVEITMSLESKTKAGQIHDVAVTQVTAKSGQPLEVAIGDFQLSLTPNISSE